MRVSRDSEGRVVLFGGGRQRFGRSAYICSLPECAEKGLAKDRLARALRRPVTQEELEQLRKDIECKLR